MKTQHHSQREQRQQPRRRRSIVSSSATAKQSFLCTAVVVVLQSVSLPWSTCLAFQPTAALFLGGRSSAESKDSKKRVWPLARDTLSKSNNHKSTIMTTRRRRTNQGQSSDSNIDTTTNDEDDNTTTKNMNPIVKLIGGTTSAFVSGSFYLAMVLQRDALMAAFFIGSIANAILSKVLKKLISQTRPEALDTAAASVLPGASGVQPSDGGMPSSHAMSLGFIGTFTVLHVSLPLLRQLAGAATATQSTILAGGVGIPLLIWTFTLISLYYRVQVNLHTKEQVVVGYILGSTNAWLFQTCLESSIMQALGSSGILNDDGLLPYPLLAIPALVGVLIVGSVERRIAYWLKQYRAAKKKEEATSS